MFYRPVGGHSSPDCVVGSGIVKSYNISVFRSSLSYEAQSHDKTKQKVDVVCHLLVSVSNLMTLYVGHIITLTL